ncbi:Uncharacterised protein [Slackia heliotrinireducens]|uniref:Tail assembly chaperone n=1 Tax=Slackia heliotrinireducens (strain ATCC 29202 / DSM 20476 / NCTC 11029 / RHS 1) TaxID=471855 RepID=C7N6N3_SLAHD|nr:hypothetical protein [Slackia heliotrinireducens]ACV22568.1 hypothetical protein Shel_15490 [Slackia heliotrinireducens DSM 20476]VEH01047.1 Uncharacterised protein [Slackia heliotrinireducens]
MAAALKLAAERPALEVDVAGDVYRVPLTFNRRELAELAAAEDDAEAMFAFFGRYLPCVDDLGDDALAALTQAWMAAREGIGAPSMGEPAASPTA